jgi:hypothetical protein
MTYPPSSSGYPPSQQPTTQFSAPTQQFGKVEQPSAQAVAPAAAGPSKLPFILLAAVAVLGLLVFLFSFGPQFKIEASDFSLGSGSPTTLGLQLAVVAALLSGLIAAASLLPKQKAPVGVVAAIAVLAFLLVIAEVVQTPSEIKIGWALYVVIFLTFVQAAVAIGALLFDAGVISAPVPKPKYEQQPQYGQYGAPNQYYGQHAPHQGGPQQRPPYAGQYGGYSGGASSGGGYAAAGQPNGPPTPPTGFPTYSQPQATPSTPTGQVPAQSQPQSSSSSSSSSNQSGNSPS